MSDKIAVKITISDIGVIAGRQGLFCVRAGADPPDNVFPCSQSARDAAKPSDVLLMTDGTTCARAEFTPFGQATREQRAAAIAGMKSPIYPDD